MIGEQTPDDPIGLFADWLREAEDKEINDPTALALATVGVRISATLIGLLQRTLRSLDYSC